MGAGNRYTLEENNSILAAQFDISCDCHMEDIFDCECGELMRDHLIDVIRELPLAKKYGMTDDRNSFYYGECYMIDLKSNYYGDAIVIDLSYQRVEYESLQIHNYEKVYNRIIKHINKQLPLFFGHGYTRSMHKPNELFLAP